MSVNMAGRGMYVSGEWVTRDRVIEVRDPQDNSLIDTVPAASREDLEATIEAAREGAQIAAAMPTHQRMSILRAAARFIDVHSEDYAITIAREGSKTIREARKEVMRCVQTLDLCADEARHIHGETIAFDQSPSGEGRSGYYYRFPVGIVAAITPFNDPLNLVAHKVGPAIAAGNAVIVKPATVTPLSALMLAEAFTMAGLPPKVLSVITGYGKEIGDGLVTHPAVRVVSFTGGLTAGEEIAKKAGLKKMGMELGSNSPVIVLADADVDDAVEASVQGSFWAAGQNCLGVQRVFIEQPIYSLFVEKFVRRTEQMQVGDKLSEETDMGPLITEAEAIRVESWVDEAVAMGAVVQTGGKRDGAFYQPTVLTNVPLNCRIVNEEVFGPVVSLIPVSGLDEAVERANSVNYGLQAGIFTSNIHSAYEAINRLQVGGVMINDSSDYRLDAMPFGGVKGSGIGREGVRFAIEEMTELKAVCFKLQ